MRLSEASFRSVVEGAPYAICRANFEGRLLQVNPALQKILGYESADEMIRTILGSDVFQRADDFQKLIELLRTTGEFHDVEAEWKRKDGVPSPTRHRHLVLGAVDSEDVRRGHANAWIAERSARPRTAWRR